MRHSASRFANDPTVRETPDARAVPDPTEPALRQPALPAGPTRLDLDVAARRGAPSTPYRAAVPADRRRPDVANTLGVAVLSAGVVGGAAFALVREVRLPHGCTAVSVLAAVFVVLPLPVVVDAGREWRATRPTRRHPW
jgi:hypothetical protein